jgi:nucleotide-binding universal stress UspA family protein
MADTAGQGPVELGRLLADARGYSVVAHDGAPLGTLERVRYEHEVSRPDDVVVRARGLFRRRRRTFPFGAVAAISVRESTVTLCADAL